jgi:ATP-dependent helicase/nuclease subunit A
MPGLTEQQLVAATSHATQILVSAGAGSGKTHVLVERYIERLKRDPNLAVSQLVAVTFTRKAANEMRIRLKTRLRGLLEQCPEDECERWSKCLAEIDGAKIGTIHSLCESIIKAFPLDAGVDPQLEVLDDLGQAELLQASIDQAFREVIAQQTPEHELLVEFDLSQIRQWITAALKSSLQFTEAIAPMKDLDLDGFSAHAGRVMLRLRQRALTCLRQNKYWHHAISVLASGSPAEMTGTLDQFRLAALQHAQRVLDAEQMSIADPVDVSYASANLIENRSAAADDKTVWQSLIELSELKPKNTGGNKEQAKATRAAIKRLRELSSDVIKRIPAELNESDPDAFQCCSKLIALAQRAYTIYGAAKRERLTADYNDLIVFALNALKKDGSAARSAYNDSVAEILVDEFQDTNRMQSELLGLLAGKQTTLFLIGDDKQSIYKFQGADVSTFNEWKERIAATADGALLSLSRSFRSHPQVVRFINDLFCAVMNDSQSEGTTFSARFEKLEAARKENDQAAEAKRRGAGVAEADEQSGGGDEGSRRSDYNEFRRVEVVCYTPVSDDSARRRSEVSRQAEASAVANWILEKIAESAPVSNKDGTERPIRYGDFAILVQRNKDFSEIEDALVQFGIPYVMLGGKNFLDRQEIFDVENLLSFLAQPLDDHALLAALRSPMFAVSDDLIHAVGSARTSTTSLWQSLVTASRQRKSGYEPIKAAVAQLKMFLHDAGRLQLSHLIRKIVERTAYDIVLLTLPNGHQRSRNLWKLVSLANEHDELTCGEFAHRLRMMRDLKVQQSDAPLDTKDSVKLMTIHSSKGLEFPAVILPVLDVSAAARNDRVVFHRDYGLAFNTARTDEEIKPSWYRTACSINDELEAAEKKRLFYVAATRARDYLGMFVDNEARDVPSFRLWLREWLGFEEETATEGSTITCRAEREGICSVRFIEASADSCDTEYGGEPGAAEAIASTLDQGIRISWDLVWNGMESEVVPPPANAGVRITAAVSRQHLESTVVGTFFHALMEHMPDDPSTFTEELMRSLAVAQGVAVADAPMLQQLLDEGSKLVQTFVASDLCKILKDSRRRLHEMPYMISSRGDVAVKRPDLILEDHQGRWHIIDYKTDHVSLAEVQNQLQKHTRQLIEYANDLRALTGLQFTASLYFAQLGLLVEVPQSTPVSMADTIAVAS